MPRPPLYPFQTKALETLGQDSVNLALTAPTGAGKGRILEVLAKSDRERILVLTPLIALARQQKSRLSLAGIPANRVRVLSPESALLQASAIRGWKPTLVAVDEAHCVHEWGERFRPAYGRLLAFLRSIGVGRTLWMSATFPRDLLVELERELPGKWIHHGHFRRPEGLDLVFLRTDPTERIEKIFEDCRQKSGPGLLFVSTRKAVHRYRTLLGSNRATVPYHAGMSDEERRTTEALLYAESTGAAKTTVVATSAFGMGMDFPQFEWAILTQAPHSLLALMQAAGRVARRRAGSATLYWADEDFRFAGLLSGPENTRGQADLAYLRRYLESCPANRAELERELFL